MTIIAKKVKTISVSSLKENPKNIETLNEKEYLGLKRRIEKFGFLKHEAVEITPDNVLLDGHHRVKICRELGIKKVTAVVVTTNDEERYIIDKNLQRRHLSMERLKYYRGRLFEHEKKSQGAPIGSKNNKKSQKSKVKGDTMSPLTLQKKTAQKIAKEHDVTERTVYRDARFANSLDKIAKIKPELKKAVFSGEKINNRKISAGKVIKMAKELDSKKTKKQKEKVIESFLHSTPEKPKPKIEEPKDVASGSEFEDMKKARDFAVDEVKALEKHIEELNQRLEDYKQENKKLNKHNDELMDKLGMNMERAIKVTSRDKPKDKEYRRMRETTPPYIRELMKKYPEIIVRRVQRAEEGIVAYVRENGRITFDQVQEIYLIPKGSKTRLALIDLLKEHYSFDIEVNGHGIKLIPDVDIEKFFEEEKPLNHYDFDAHDTWKFKNKIVRRFKSKGKHFSLFAPDSWDLHSITVECFDIKGRKLDFDDERSEMGISLKFKEENQAIAVMRGGD